jgi:spermidine/putrescine transport system ATP-binding protein
MSLSAESRPAPVPAEQDRDCPTDPVIKLDAVRKTFGNTVVIHRLDLDVKRGEFLTLLGPSGCGKTTTLKMIAGFETPSAGRILLDGMDVSTVPPYGRLLNTVFQQYALFPHMTAFENVAFGPRTTGLDRNVIKERVTHALDMVNMSAHSAKKPSQMSGGQQQRIALARALVNYPKALLLDEPLSALDVKLRHAMQLELKRIQMEVNTTFIFVTHDQEEALTMSSRIAVMNEGYIEQLDTPEEIYKRPKTQFVANFIGQANLLPGQAAAGNGGEIMVELDGGGAGPAAAPDSIAPGDRVLLMVRPGQAALSLGRRDSPTHGFAARLRSLDFQGSVFRYALTRADGREVIVTLLPQHQLADAGIGAEVWVTWDARHAWIVPARN